MFAEQFKKLMEKRKLTAREMHAILNERGVKVSLPTVRSWMQGTRSPKPYVQEIILQLLSLTS
jgi:transcriptional regulator with XRE-family HTH domain